MSERFVSGVSAKIVLNKYSSFPFPFRSSISSKHRYRSTRTVLSTLSARNLLCIRYPHHWKICILVSILSDLETNGSCLVAKWASAVSNLCLLSVKIASDVSPFNYKYIITAYTSHFSQRSHLYTAEMGSDHTIRVHIIRRTKHWQSACCIHHLLCQATNVLKSLRITLSCHNSNTFHQSQHGSITVHSALVSAGFCVSCMVYLQ